MPFNLIELTASGIRNYSEVQKKTKITRNSGFTKEEERPITYSCGQHKIWLMFYELPLTLHQQEKNFIEYINVLQWNYYVETAGFVWAGNQLAFLVDNRYLWLLILQNTSVTCPSYYYMRPVHVRHMLPSEHGGPCFTFDMSVIRTPRVELSL